MRRADLPCKQEADPGGPVLHDSVPKRSPVMTTGVDPDYDTLSRRAAEPLRTVVRAVPAPQNTFGLAVSRGSTLRQVYQNRSEMEIFWNQSYWLWGDERFWSPHACGEQNAVGPRNPPRLHRPSRRERPSNLHVETSDAGRNPLCRHFRSRVRRLSLHLRSRLASHGRPLGRS